MENLNNVPSTGTFGGSINQVNQNFGLVKDAIENVEGRTIRSKGLFPTQAALIAAYPSPKVGDYAYVGSSLPATIYDCEVEGTWHNTQQQGGSETINLGAYSTTVQMNAAIDSGLQGQVGYAECNTGASTTRKDVVVSGFKLLASGGALHIKMTNANTAANATMNISPTSTVVSANTKPLFYNGVRASSTNTWEANEIISVYYDGTNYQATNSQGGGVDAEKIKYDNSTSGLAADNVQDAVDVMANNLNEAIGGEVTNQADLDIADGQGNVLVRFENGHVKTKMFDSREVMTKVDTDAYADLDIADEEGNVLLRLVGGHIKTKKFDSEKYFSYKRRNFFTHKVDVTNYLATDADYSDEDVNTHEIMSLYDDNCVLYLPETYSQNGEPTKLIIYCKHGDTYITAADGSDDIVGTGSMGKIFRYMLHLGYGILAADGVPDGWKEELGLLERAVGNYVAVESTIRAFDYVKNHYNVDADNVFIFGYSQGGMYAQNVIDNSNIPFAAAAQMSPVSSMRYQQWDNMGNVTPSFPWTYPSRYNIAKIFNFPEFSTNTELAALEYDYGKTVGYDPWSRNVDNMYTGFVQGTTYGNNLWGLPAGTTLDDITMKKHVKCPLKIWGSKNDNVIGSDVWKVFIKAIKNSGQAADIQLYTTGQHNPPTLQSSIGTFEENGETLNLYPIAVDVALWFFRFGGYPLKSYTGNN